MMMLFTSASEKPASIGPCGPQPGERYSTLKTPIFDLELGVHLIPLDVARDELRSRTADRETVAKVVAEQTRFITAPSVSM
jgi:hypothetical protein